MDVFLREIQHVIYYKWVLIQLDNTFVETRNELFYSLTAKKENYEISIIFWNHHLVEQQIINNHTQEVIFYVHFQFHDFLQGKRMLRNFLSFIYRTKRTYKILLVCSCGVTTALFSEKLSQQTTQEKIQITVNSCSVYSLSNYDLESYDHIYLAPQIAYLQAKLSALTTRTFSIIDTAIFATNNVNAFLRHLESILKV